MPLIADFHIHTVASGHAYSTIEQYAEAAKKKGLKIIAMTDHGPAMPGGPHYYHFSNLVMIPEKINGVRILKGVEANIINEQGQIDLEKSELQSLDIVMVAMHPRCGYQGRGVEENTQALLQAMDNPYINILAHPGNAMYPVSIDSVIEKAKQKGILIEINNSTFTGSRKGSYDNCLKIAKKVKQIGWKVVLGTDSHISSMVGNFDEALKLVKKAGITEKDIINSSEKLINQYLLNRNK